MRGQERAALLGHVVGPSAAFRAAAEKDFGPLTDTDLGSAGGRMPRPTGGRGRRASPGPRHRVVPQTAWEGMTRVGGVDLPGNVAGVVSLRRS